MCVWVCRSVAVLFPILVSYYKCITMWCLNVLSLEQWYVQNVHVNDFTEEWVLMCRLRFAFLLVWNWQCGQAKGFSPVWVRIWTLRFSSWIALKGQYGHGNGLSPVWVLICFFRFVVMVVLYGQEGHWWTLLLTGWPLSPLVLCLQCAPWQPGSTPTCRDAQLTHGGMQWPGYSCASLHHIHVGMSHCKTCWSDYTRHVFLNFFFLWNGVN